VDILEQEGTSSQEGESSQQLRLEVPSSIRHRFHEGASSSQRPSQPATRQTIGGVFVGPGILQRFGASDSRSSTRSQTIFEMESRNLSGYARSFRNRISSQIKRGSKNCCCLHLMPSVESLFIVNGAVIPLKTRIPQSARPYFLPPIQNRLDENPELTFGECLLSEYSECLQKNLSEQERTTLADEIIKVRECIESANFITGRRTVPTTRQLSYTQTSDMNNFEPSALTLLRANLSADQCDKIIRGLTNPNIQKEFNTKYILRKTIHEYDLNPWRVKETRSTKFGRPYFVNVPVSDRPSGYEQNSEKRKFREPYKSLLKAYQNCISLEVITKLWDREVNIIWMNG
jgi:hypothetical protein